MGVGNRRWWAVLLAGVLIVASGIQPVRADDWVTKGGTSKRSSRSDEAVGVSQGEAWRLEAESSGVLNSLVDPRFGESATQPIVVKGEVDYEVYHLAGAYLWRAVLGADGRATEASPLNGTESTVPRPNVDPVTKKVITPSSSPTYSAESGVIYWGNSSGYLWSYNTRTNKFRHIDLLPPCKVVGSPLVLRIDGRDVVIVGDRPDDAPVPQGGCTNEMGGNLWVVWGLDDPARQSEKAQYQRDALGTDYFQGWVTPSAIPMPAANQFVAGADGVALNGCDGKAMVFVVQSVGDGFQLAPGQWQVCSPSGFAGSMASDGGSAYWMDTTGTLFGANLDDGRHPPAWPDRVTTQNLPSMVAPGGRAFTNTEPAIGADGSVYVTLRNFVDGTEGISLRGCGREDAGGDHAG
jgi:hypothetical protein